MSRRPPRPTRFPYTTLFRSGSMRARLVVESGEWALMKGQGTFDNIDELFALGYAGVALGDQGRADAAIDNLRTAAKTVPDEIGRASCRERVWVAVVEGAVGG